jgi:hypothetical protein
VREIVLPAGSEAVTIGLIPELIARALHPEPAHHIEYRGWAKRLPNRESSEPLSAEDRARLANIWRDLPDFEQTISETDFPRYTQAFDEAPDKPDWELVAHQNDHRSIARILRYDEVDRHAKELERAINSGRVVPRDRAGLASLGYPTDVLLIDDFKGYVKLFGITVRIESKAQTLQQPSGQVAIGEGDWLTVRDFCQRVADAMHVDEGDNVEVFFDLLTELEDLSKQGKFSARDAKSRIQRPYLIDDSLRNAVVSFADVRTMLADKGLKWREDNVLSQPNVAVVGDEDVTATNSAAAQGEPEPQESAGKDAPLGLTTGHVAFCFAGLRDWDEARWKKELGNKSKWLERCIVTPGKQGVSAHSWDPVLIGVALVSKGFCKVNRVRSKFQMEPLLHPWLESWRDHEATYFPKD